MKVDRRWFIGNSLGVTAAVALVNVRPGFTKQLGTGPDATGWSTDGLSTVIVQDAIRDMVVLVNRMDSRSETVADVLAAHDSTRILHAHLRGLGFTAYMDAQFSARREQLLAHDLSEGEVQNLIRLSRDNGLNLPDAKMRRALATAQDTRSAALDHVAAVGLDRVHSEARRCLYAHALYLQRNRRTSQRQRFQSGSIVTALYTPGEQAWRFVPLTDGCTPEQIEEQKRKMLCKKLKLIKDTIAIVAAMNGAGCALGCVPCCAIAITAGIAVAFYILQLDLWGC